jgi:putative ABC transport system substrate-binding protein
VKRRGFAVQRLAARRASHDPFAVARLHARVFRHRGVVRLEEPCGQFRLELIAEFGRRQRLPIVSGWDSLTEVGALVSYAPNLPAMFRRSASYVDRILKGAKPSDLPIEQASSVERVINVKTARALGIAIPQSMPIRADRVIE